MCIFPANVSYLPGTVPALLIPLLPIGLTIASHCCWNCSSHMRLLASNELHAVPWPGGDGFLVRLSLSQRPVRHLSKADVNWATQWRHMDMAHSCSKALQSVSALVSRPTGIASSASLPLVSTQEKSCLVRRLP